MTQTKNILLLGATGAVGSAILAELTARGHEVTAAIRPGGRAPTQTGIHSVEVDPRDEASLAATAQGFDAVVSAIGGRATGDFSVVADIAQPLLAAAADTRLVVIGGAGGLLDVGERRRIDDPSFPDAWKRSSLPQTEALEIYRADTTGVDWVYVAPSDLIAPGGPTGDIERGGDRLLRAADGSSEITVGDLAVVVADEIDTPTAHRARITARTR